METTPCWSVNMFMEVAHAHGVRHAVLSPGSRNAPLTMAAVASGLFECHDVVDERSAAFIALGIARTTSLPVMLICTSGTALYDYSPAVAEAYYRHIPLIVVSADRPKAWIGQDDSQTLLQPEALRLITKWGCTFEEDSESEHRWYNNRIANNAMLRAVSEPAGPVHINIPVAGPISGTEPYRAVNPRIVEEVATEGFMTLDAVKHLVRRLKSAKRVMIVCGFAHGDSRLNGNLQRMASNRNIIVLTEVSANIRGAGFVDAIDATLARITAAEETEFQPDIVITIGGALVSRRLKEFLRKSGTTEHWYVGLQEETVDCFRHLTKHFVQHPAVFLGQLNMAMTGECCESDYARKWRKKAEAARLHTVEYAESAPWSDFKALSYIFTNLPRWCRLHLSNGTVVRYAQLFAPLNVMNVDCNRGVSGIDGSTSTAVGCAIADKDYPSVLITGDTSALYDSGVLVAGNLPANFRMVVMDNGGGAIFRYIKATRNLPVMERHLAGKLRVPWNCVAETASMKCFEAASFQELPDKYNSFINSDCASMLVIHTDGVVSTEVLDQYFENHDQQT